jgi:hypothetical protein
MFKSILVLIATVAAAAVVNEATWRWASVSGETSWWGSTLLWTERSDSLLFMAGNVGPALAIAAAIIWVVVRWGDER